MFAAPRGLVDRFPVKFGKYPKRSIISKAFTGEGVGGWA